MANITVRHPIKQALWTPAQLPGLSGSGFWYKADAETYADGALVATMTDMSGNGRNATQGTDANKPTFKTNILNGKPVYRFAGSQILSTAAYVFGGQQYSVLFVLNVTNSSGGRNLVEMSTLYANNNAFLIWWTGDPRLAVDHHGITGNLQVEFKVTAVLNTTSFYSAIASGDLSLSTNEATAQVGADTVGFYNFNNNVTDSFNQSHAIFIGDRSGGGLGINGDIAEIVCIASAISATDIQNWRTYVLQKYGVP